jgi:hypothetical protein
LRTWTARRLRALRRHRAAGEQQRSGEYGGEVSQ